LLNGSAMLCANGRIQKAIAMMVENIERPIGMDEIAYELNISTRQLERIFARYGFDSPGRYFKELRLERARQLLEQSELSLAEVSLACGFESQNNFSKGFKKRFGVSPRYFRTPHGGLQRLRENMF
jgi:transcriptional regulator GlxA family with amidase domain